MELAIGIILGIAAGVTGFWIFSRKQKDELDSLRKAKTDLTAERDNIQKDNVGLENQLKEANVQIGDLESNLTEKTTQISTFESEVKQKTARISNLESEVTEKTARINTLESEVKQKIARIDTLTNNLREATARINTLESEVKQKTARISNLESEVTEKTARINTLTNNLQKAGREIDTLTNNLKAVSASNENALQLLYLFELSLQLAAFALYSEVSRATRLGGENKKLHTEYKRLYTEYGKSVDRYEKLCEEVERKTKGRLVRSGVGAALSLIPGIGFFQFAGDLMDLADFITDVVEGTADFYDMISVVEPSVDLINFLVDFIELKSIESLHPEISSDQEREKVRQKHQSILKEVFAQNLAQGNKNPNASDFYKFLKAMIQRVKDFVDSMSESERQNALKRLVHNFGHFGIALYSHHKSPQAHRNRSLPVPEN